MNDQNNILSFIPLGGIGDVTRNMYLYEFRDEILIVDCGLGFPDETTLGVDLLLPDISYLLKEVKNGKRIIGMLLTHGHEDHVGALPFILTQLPSFPIFGTPLTAAFANEKLSEFGIKTRVQTVHFERNTVQLGSFNASFIRVTHSIPDTSHIVIATPIGNFYHGSDFKFDDTPWDGKITDYNAIRDASRKQILCLLSDCLGAERQGRTPSEQTLIPHFIQAMQQSVGKTVVTTYSSNVSRLNQIIAASEKTGKKVCFVGRSLIKTKEAAKKLGYLMIGPGTEVKLEDLREYPDKQLTLIVAGSQGQENSALSRIANSEHREIRLKENDTVIFSSDPIPGNELAVYELVDTLAKKEINVLYSPATRDFHVSGHGGSEELEQLIDLVKPQKMIPIGGAFRHMHAYKNLVSNLGYKKSDVLLLEDGQEVIFEKNNIRLGKIIPLKNVYVDEISGEEIESFVLRDRQKLSEGGIVVVLVEVDSANGQLVGKPDIIIRGFAAGEDNGRIIRKLSLDIKNALTGRKGRVTNWVHIRRFVGETAERRIFRDLKRRPLVLPVVIEV